MATSASPQDEPAKPSKPSAWRLAWPVIACLLFLTWSMIPPYRMHINEVPWGDKVFAWNWRLFEHGGRGYCEVRYFDMNRGGAPIERWKLLGFERPGEMPDHIARTRIKGLWPAYAQVCAALEQAGDPAPNVRVFARCGRELGWETVEHRRRDVCARVRRDRDKANAKQADAKQAKAKQAKGASKP